MTAPSPVDLATDAIAYTVTSNGTALDPSTQIVSIDVWTGVNRLPKARLVISDGSPDAEDFPLSDSALLVPGVALAISLGYGDDTSTIFSGIIHRQGLDVTIDGPPRLIVEATSKAMAMTLARGNAVWQDTTDSAVCEALISAAGMTPKVTSTSTTHPAIVQYYASPWDLLILRAQASGMVVIADGDAVTVAPPDTSGDPVLTLTYGISILDFQAEMDAATQIAADAVQSFAWDPATQALLQSSSAQSSVTTPGDIGSATLAAVFGVSPYVQQSAGAMAADELTQWSSAELMKTQLAKIRGTVRFQGSTLAVPGSMVTLAGVGTRFDGGAWVSEVHHRLSEGLWRTTLGFGLSPGWFAATAPQVAAPGAAGQLPPAHNLQTGTVKQIDQDPAGETRVLVTLPLLQASDGVWARLGGFYASNGFGAFFFPEVGDEVVVGFLGGDPRYPVILGSLYSAKNVAPETPAAENNTKTIVTREKLRIDFLEDSKAIKVLTPGNQSIVLSDDDKSIVLTDMNGNSVTLGTSGIAIKSGSDISITATGSITLSADNALSLSGSASGELKSSGMVQVKGATVALNP